MTLRLDDRDALSFEMDGILFEPNCFILSMKKKKRTLFNF